MDMLEWETKTLKYSKEVRDGMATNPRPLKFKNHPELPEVRFTQEMPCPDSPLPEGRVWIKVIHFTVPNVAFSYQEHSNSRVIQSLEKDKLVLADFERLNFTTTENCRHPNSEYILRVLNNGVIINGLRYRYFGQSNSQLKQRKCFLYRADDDQEIQRTLDKFGDWSGFSSVAKLAKRIGLLFSTGNKVLDLPAANYEMIDDVQRNGHCFTDGCGFSSGELVRKVAKRLKLSFRDKRYYPSVIQIRYHGFKGILLHGSHLTKTSCHFRHSMCKFKYRGPNDFFVVDWSKPYTFGSLNMQTVMLLSSLGVSDDAFLAKQDEHFQRLETMFTDPRIAFEYLLTSGEVALAGELFENGFTNNVVQFLNRAYKKELNLSLKIKRNASTGATDHIEKLRILVKDSRIVFAAADPTGKLHANQCFFRPTLHNAPTTVTGPVFCVRNPCYHAGDILVLQAVHLTECDHIVDVLLFSTEGKVPAAHRSAGGDLDGDKFFICWDQALMPQRHTQSYGYPGVPEKTNRSIQRTDMVQYFANHSNAGVARCANLFLKWAEAKGPRCDECLEINALFSQAVDGSSVRIAKHLQEIPQLDNDVSQGRIWNKLVAVAESKRADRVRHQKQSQLLRMDCDEVVQFLDCDAIEATDYELLNFLISWCRSNGADIAEFLYLLDFSHFTSYERLEAVVMVPRDLLYNGLSMSHIISNDAIFRFGLTHSNWKLFHANGHQMGEVSFAANLVHDLYRALTTFHRVFVVLRCAHELSFGIALHGPFEPNVENDASEVIHVYGFDDQGLVMQEKRCHKGYQLIFSEGHFQFYEHNKTNTFIWIGLPQRLPNRVVSLNELSIHSQVSIAVNRLNHDVSRKSSRIRKNRITASEIYVVSNRDGICTRYQSVNPQYEAEEEVQDFDADYLPPDPAAPKNEKDAELLLMPAEDAHQSIDELLQRLECWISYGLYDKAIEACCNYLAVPRDASHIEHMARLSARNPILYSPLVTYVSSDETCDSCSSATVMHLLCSSLKCVRCSRQPLIMENVMRLLNLPWTLGVPEVLTVVRALVIDYADTWMAMDYLDEFFYLLEMKLEDQDAFSPWSAHYFLRQLRLLCLQTLEEFLPIQSKVKSANRYRSHQTEALAKDHPSRFILVSLGTDAVPMRPGDVLALKRLNRKSVEPIAIIRAVVFSTVQDVQVNLSWVPRDISVATWKVKNVGNVVGFRQCVDAISRLYPVKPGPFSPLLQCLLEPGTFLTSDTENLPFSQNCDLNPSQLTAVIKAEAGLLTLWQGPAGTGKTKSIYSLILRLLQNKSKFPILVTGATNAAVDNITKLLVERSDANVVRIGDLRSILPELHSITLDMSAEGRFRKMDSKKAQKLLKGAEVICATCVGCGSVLLEKFEFDFVVVDEASQVSEPVCLIPLAKKSKRFVLVGDHRQLRPFCTRRAEEAGYNISLFERLVDRAYPFSLLNTQYRMHPGIAEFPNGHFYAGRLRNGIDATARPLVPGFAWPNQKVPVAFVQVLGQEVPSKGSRYNLAEVQNVVATVTAVLKEGMASDDVGVISLYSAQVQKVKFALSEAGPGTENVEVKTADGFQGREKELILITCVRCNELGDIGFLQDEHRFNVMLTRAKRGMVVFGDRATLCSNDMWQKWFNWIDSNGLNVAAI